MTFGLLRSLFKFWDLVVRVERESRNIKKDKRWSITNIACGFHIYVKPVIPLCVCVLKCRSPWVRSRPPQMFFGGGNVAFRRKWIGTALKRLQQGTPRSVTFVRKKVSCVAGSCSANPPILSFIFVNHRHGISRVVMAYHLSLG